MRKLFIAALLIFGSVGSLSAQHLGDPIIGHQDTIHVVDTVHVRPPYVRHDTVFIVDTVYDNSIINYDYYDYYCGGVYWNSIDCNGYLHRSQIVYIPRIRTFPTFIDRQRYIPRRYPFIVPDRVVRPRPPAYREPVRPNYPVRPLMPPSRPISHPISKPTTPPSHRP